MTKAEARAPESRPGRPSVEYVRGVWRMSPAAWAGADDEERARLMPLLVEQATPTEKNAGRPRRASAPAAGPGRALPPGW